MLAKTFQHGSLLYPKMLKCGWEAGVCGGIVGGRVHFVRYAFLTIKKCTSTEFLL